MLLQGGCFAQRAATAASSPCLRASGLEVSEGAALLLLDGAAAAAAAGGGEVRQERV